ncbi:hypothetical protein ACFL6Y_05705 [Elusimicrobiota bacterium]
MAQTAGRAHFLTHGPGSAEEALGEAVVASVFGPNALYYNAAGLGRGEGGVTGEYTKLLPGVSYSWLGSAFTVSGNSMGLGVLSLDLGEITTRESIQDPGSIAKSYQRAYFLGLSRPIGGRTRLGASLGFLDFRLADYESKAKFIDLGASARITRHLSLGAALKNAYFSGLSFAGNKEVYPQELRTGLVINRGIAQIMVQAEKVLDGSKPKYAIGFGYSPLKILSFRAGLNGNPRFGFGLTTKSNLFGLDFSWVSKTLSPTSRVSLSYFFRDDEDSIGPFNPYDELKGRAKSLESYLKEESKRLLQAKNNYEASKALEKLLAINPSSKNARHTLNTLTKTDYKGFVLFPIAFTKQEKARRMMYLRWSIGFAQDFHEEHMTLGKDFMCRWPGDKRSELISKLSRLPKVAACQNKTK